MSTINERASQDLAHWITRSWVALIGASVAQESMATFLCVVFAIALLTIGIILRINPELYRDGQ